MNSSSLFPLGRIVITRSALAALASSDVHAGLRRHARADWGDLDREDRNANNDGLCRGGRLLSAYDSIAGTRFWIITEADRSATTILLPDDY